MPADVATAEAMAKGRMRKLAEGFVTAEVEMIGNAGVQPGAVLIFDKMGEKLDGKYRVEKARHAFDKHGYRVTASVVRTSPKKASQAQPPKAATVRELPPPQPSSLSAGIAANPEVEYVRASVGADLDLERVEATVEGSAALEQVDASVSAGRH
jgi:hypothetical protein